MYEVNLLAHPYHEKLTAQWSAVYVRNYTLLIFKGQHLFLGPLLSSLAQWGGPVP